MRKNGLIVLLVLCGCLDDPNDPQTWIKKLDDPREQKEAVRQLVKLKDKQAVAPLVALYRKSQSVEDLRAITSFADPSTVPVLIEALDYTEETYERASLAANTLANIGDAQAVPALCKAAEKKLPVKSRANVTRAEAIKALTRFKDARAVPSLIAILSTSADEQDFFLNKLAAQALAAIPDARAIPSLVRGLYMTGRGTDIYQPCRIALLAIGEPAVEPLLETLQHKNAAVEEDGKKYEFLPGIIVHKAASVLGDLGARKAVPLLLELLKKKEEGTPPQGVPTRTAALRALGLIGDAQAVRPIMAVLSDGKRSVDERVAAAEALNLLGDAQALPALQAAARVKWLSGQTVDPELATLAAAAITGYSRLAGSSAPAFTLPTVDPALADMHEIVANAAERLALVKDCGTDRGCYVKALAGAKPVRSEKAAFMLARGGKENLAALVQQIPNKEPLVRFTVLLGLRRLADGTCKPCKDALDAQITSDDSKQSLRPLVDEMRAVRALLH